MKTQIRSAHLNYSDADRKTVMLLTVMLIRITGINNYVDQNKNGITIMLIGIPME